MDFLVDIKTTFGIITSFESGLLKFKLQLASCQRFLMLIESYNSLVHNTYRSSY